MFNPTYGLIASKNKGRAEFPCNVSGCDEWQNIDELMRNAPTVQDTPQAMLNEEILEIKSELQKVRQDIRLSDRFDQKRFQKLSQGQKEILSKLDGEFSKLMQMFTDEAKEGPRLFSFKPLEPGFFERPKWIGAKFQLTLWCEHSRKPLPTLNPEQSEQGVYELTLTREWLTKAAPYLKFMTTTIGLVLPVAASATKAILDDTAYKSIEEELDLAQKSIEFSIKGSDIAVGRFTKTDAPDIDADIEDWGESTRAEGSMLRQLHALLKDKDPGFGGLVRVQNKRQEFLWVHPQFVKEY
ncbi:MAG: hypothetical protein AAF349_20720 [Cyanobacteria bacterium P01_A01_bin.68]